MKRGGGPLGFFPTKHTKMIVPSLEEYKAKIVPMPAAIA
jgi:hypothetical protein